MRVKEIFKGFFGKGTYPSFLSFWLDFPLRKLIISPKTIAERLYLKENHKVLEIGPGPGFFSGEIARRITRGHLFLLDLQREMLLKARKKMEKKKLFNVSYIEGDAVKLPLKDNFFDIVFLITVLGEVSSPQLCMNNIYKSLKPGGLLSITEQFGDPDRISFEDLYTMAKNSGFKFLKKYGSNKNFTANFQKPA